MSSPSQTINNGTATMYNLQVKRTLPREVIKWMQGLDLSYSVKDYRKDMSNGFLIGEIISRYEADKIPMHAFENSQNNIRRDNNWSQLTLFFKKHSLREIEIAADEFALIMKGTDSKSQQLYQFICRLYTICTKRTLPENAPLLDLPPTQANNPNQTTSYLLKQDGLQKLSNNNSNLLGSSGNKSNVVDNRSNAVDNRKVEEKAQDRVPTRKIVPNMDSSSNMVDVIGIGVKADNRKMTSKRKSWEVAKEQSNYSEDNPDNEKLIFHYLNEIIEECIPDNDQALRQILFPHNHKYKPTQILKTIVPNVDPEFFCNFLHQIQLNSSELVPIILRQINETWKFFSYFLKFVRVYSFQSQQFGLIIDILKGYAVCCHARQSRRLQKVFNDSVLSSIMGQAKLCKQWKKRERIMGLIYDFEGRELGEKKCALSRLKERLGSHNPLYIEWLAVLVREETLVRGNLDNKLIDDYIYYAHQYLPSSVQLLRLSALKILYQISKTQAIELIQKHFISKAANYQQSQCDPQQTLLLILIYTNLLRELIASKEYQHLVKGNHSNNLVKVYNPDNEKNMQQLKRRAQLIGQTIYKLFNCTSDVTVREITARIAISLLSQSQFMMKTFLQFITIVRQKKEFMRAEQTEYELKTMRYECAAVEVEVIEEHSNEILVDIIGLVLSHGANIEEYLYLINHSLRHLNVKKLNMEIWEDISLHLVKPYTDMIHLPLLAGHCWEGITNICNIFFNFDMKIRELTSWLAKGIEQVQRDNHPQTVQQVQRFNQFLNAEYKSHHQESVRFMTQELSQLLEARGLPGIISLTH